MCAEISGIGFNFLGENKMFEQDEIDALRIEVYELKQEIQTLETCRDHYKDLATVRLEKITTLEEENQRLQSILDDQSRARKND